MQISLGKYPYNKDCALTITIDDLHPESKEDLEGLDFGYDFNDTFWREIKKMLKFNPDIKLNLFTVANWIDRSDFPAGLFFPLRKLLRIRRSYPENIFNISNKKYQEWISKLNQRSRNIDYLLHGLTHHNSNKKVFPSQEFKLLSKDETEYRIDEMIKIFNSSKLKYELGFRPPGWAKNNYLNRYLSKLNFLYTASLTDFEKIDEVNINPSLNYKLLEFTANCYSYQLERAIAIARKKGIIIIHTHIAKTIFNLKYVNKKFAEEVLRVIREIEHQTLNHIWFATLSEIAKFYYARKKIEIKIISEKKVELINNSQFDLSGLSLKINNKSFVISLIKASSKYTLVLSRKLDESKKVSIVLTVFNGEKNILNAVNSLVNQTYKNTEIIVVDDGSIDKTLNLVKNFKRKTFDNRIKIIHQQNLGRAAARNNGFKNSTGEIIAFCEDDAIYDKDYIFYSVKSLSKDKKIAGLIGPYYVLNKNDSLFTRIKDIERRRNFVNYKPFSCWVYKRNAFVKAGLFKEQLEFVDDIEPGIKLKQLGYKLVFEPKARWLHIEPPQFFKYLRRKYRGGLGLSMLQKARLRNRIVPIKYLIFLLTLLMSVLLILLINPLGIIYISILLVPFILLIRLKDILKVRNITNEPIAIIVLGIYIEYIWWSATFLGYVRGLFMNIEELNLALKGR